MYDILLNNINNYENYSVLWTYENNNDIYIKHCQYNLKQENQEIQEIQEKQENQEKQEIEEKQEKQKKQEKKEKKEKQEKQEIQEKYVIKKNKINPIEFILNKCNMVNTDITKNIIKDKFKVFITEHKVIKIFGQKKTSEMLSAILNNKWNISLVTLMSFMFNTKFIYLKKEILYDKNLQNYPIINI